MTGLDLIVDCVLAALLVIGGIFAVIGSFGLLKLRHPMQRLHAPTKATTIGVGSTLIVSALELYWTHGILSWQEVLVAVFLSITAPITALYLSKVYLHQRGKDGLPPTGVGGDWSTFSHPLENSNPPPPAP